MKFYLPKKIVITSLASIVFIISVALFIVFGSKPKQPCQLKEPWSCTIPYYDAKSKTYIVNGIVKQKYNTGGKHYFVMDLFDKEHNPTSVLFELPPRQFKFMINSRSKTDNSPTVEMYTSADAYDQVLVGDRVKAFIVIPNEGQIAFAKKSIKDKKYVSCFVHHGVLGTFLSSPTLFNRLRLEFENAFINCPIALYTLEK